MERYSRGRTLPLRFALALLLSTSVLAQEEETEGNVLGAASELLIERDEAQAVLLGAGTRLHEEPHRHAPVVTVVDVEATLSAIERREEWVRVSFGGRIGWAYLGAPPAEDVTPAPPPPAELELLPPDELTADQERLALAVSLLAGDPEPVAAGPFLVYTDVKGRRKRELLYKAAKHLADAYEQRYGLSPQRRASFAVVVFDRERSYRQFEDSVADLRQLDAEGHAGSGVAALVAEGRSPQEAAALLVHELAHLLNRRAFHASLPPWLEEGIANDLAYCRLDRAGRLQPQTLGGQGFIVEIPGPADRFGRRAFSGTVHIEGPLASLSLLKRKIAAGEAVPLPELLDLTWREFVAPEGRELRYVESTFLVRYLLDELSADAFRRFLTDLQAGGAADAPALLGAMDVGWERLASGFERWIEQYSGGR